MNTWIRSSALVVLLAALGLLAFAQWLPALAFLPVGTAMLLYDGQAFSVPFSTDPHRRKRNDSDPGN